MYAAHKEEDDIKCGLTKERTNGKSKPTSQLAKAGATNIDRLIGKKVSPKYGSNWCSSSKYMLSCVLYIVLNSPGPISHFKVFYPRIYFHTFLQRLWSALAKMSNVAIFVICNNPEKFIMDVKYSATVVELMALNSFFGCFQTNIFETFIPSSKRQSSRKLNSKSQKKLVRKGLSFVRIINQQGTKFLLQAVN